LNIIDTFGAWLVTLKHCKKTTAPSTGFKTIAVNIMFDRNKDRQPEKIDTPAPVAHAIDNSSTAYRAPTAATGKSAVLGATIRVKGEISGDENLLIEGHVEGSVSLSAHELSIGKTGKVHANITARTIRIDGEVHGDIAGKEKVIVSSTSNIKGTIVTPKMTLEEGARFKGTIDIDPAHANSSTAFKPTADKPA
jgi:cytoskeletal protein CcmA (bactofilin family)